MADGSIPVLRVSGSIAIIVFLYVTILFGTLHLVALAYPKSKWAQAWILLGF